MGCGCGGGAKKLVLGKGGSSDPITAGAAPTYAVDLPSGERLTGLSYIEARRVARKRGGRVRTL